LVDQVRVRHRTAHCNVATSRPANYRDTIKGQFSEEGRHVVSEIPEATGRVDGLAF